MTTEAPGRLRREFGVGTPMRLGSSLFLAFRVLANIWLAGLALIAMGLVWRWFAARLWAQKEV